MESNLSYGPESTCTLTEKSELFYNGSQITEPSDFSGYVENLSIKEGKFYTKIKNSEVLVEAEEQVLIATSIEKKDDQIVALVFNTIPIELKTDSVRVDDFDRFFAQTKKNFPVYFSPEAQDDFFNLCDEFSDEDYVWDNFRYPFLPNYEVHQNLGESFWSAHYKNASMGWDLKVPHPYLESIVSQLKLVRSEILVLGAGRAHDANFFSSLGHNVTAIDISPLAIAQAKTLYPESSKLKYICMDVFKTTESFSESFDVVFDHTFYCAIDPSKRSDLVKSWHRFLRPGGSLVGIFFSMAKSYGPPFGGSESELKLRTKKFRPLYWNRIRQGPRSRLGFEFFAMLQKKSN